MGMLLISHDLSVLADACERVAVMYAGRIVENGPAGDVFARARHPYARALAAAFPVIGDPASRRAPKGLPGDPPDPRDLPPGCPFHVRCPVAVPVCVEEDVRLRPVDRFAPAGPNGPAGSGGPAGPAWSAACVHVGAEVDA
jgi:peptide/nickel transport system ATP-binding protein